MYTIYIYIYIYNLLNALNTSIIPGKITWYSAGVHMADYLTENLRLTFNLHAARPILALTNMFPITNATHGNVPHEVRHIT